MNSIAQQPMRRNVAIGVDTHRHIHVAVALDELGGRLGELTVPADSGGYVQLEQWAIGFGRILAFGIEGTGSYGAGVAELPASTRPPGQRGQPARPTRAAHERQERCPRCRERRARYCPVAPSPRQRRATARSRCSARSRSSRTPRSRREPRRLSPSRPSSSRRHRSSANSSTVCRTLIERCAGLRPGPITTPLAATKHALRGLARRWQQLQAEIKEYEQHLGTLTAAVAPAMVAAFGIGPDTAAEMLIVAGDNPDRIRCEPARAKLCAVCPIPASSGKTSRHRLNRGGHRQANSGHLGSRAGPRQRLVCGVLRADQEGRGGPAPDVVGGVPGCNAR